MKIKVWNKNFTDSESRDLAYWERNVLALKYAQGRSETDRKKLGWTHNGREVEKNSSIEGNMKFKVGDIVKNEDGDDIRIVCVDKKGSFPIVGVFEDIVYEYSKEGVGDCAADLVAPVKPKVKYYACEDFGGELRFFSASASAVGHRRPALDLECEVDE